ncbi:MAG: hypothetical protein HUK00_07595 [Bacteroidaceae bacterium]|nr:hypothetical protein [Bacteroidaceae bacterium]
MKSKLFYLCLVVIIVGLCLLRWDTVVNERVAEDNDTLRIEVRDAAPRDQYVNGYVGDGTGMSCVEFVTLDGDTLLLNRTSDLTGRDGEILGSLQTPGNNLFALLTSDNGESVDVMVNMTELRRQWQSNGQGFSLAADNTASPVGKSAPRYLRWHLHRDCILLTREMSGEGATTEVTDTMRIVSLSPDTLVLSDHFGDHITYAACKQ